MHGERDVKGVTGRGVRGWYRTCSTPPAFLSQTVRVPFPFPTETTYDRCEDKAVSTRLRPTGLGDPSATQQPPRYLGPILQGPYSGGTPTFPGVPVDTTFHMGRIQRDSPADCASVSKRSDPSGYPVLGESKKIIDGGGVVQGRGLKAHTLTLHTHFTED